MFSKTITVENCRGISVSSVISSVRIIEHCILGKLSDYFVTSDNQFGIKKQLSCSHAVYTVGLYDVSSMLVLIRVLQ